MNIYIAGSSRELPRVKRCTELAKDLGFKPTLEWVPFIEAHGGDSVDRREREARAKNATDDIQAVLNAEILWCLIPVEQTKGMWAELGAALGMNALYEQLGYNVDKKLIICSFEFPSVVPEINPLFIEPADFICADDRDALDALNTISLGNYQGWSGNLPDFLRDRGFYE